MEEVERSAGSVEEAIEAALAELGLSEQEAHIQIVQEPRSGFLGLSSQQAIVRVRGRAPSGGSSDDADDDVDVEEQLGSALTFVEGMLEAMDMDAEVEVATVDGISYVDIWGVDSGDEMAILIGKHGHTLDSLQELIRGHVQQSTGQRCRVLVDVEDYRKRRRSQLVRKAQEVAQRVRQSGKSESLEPMSSYERKVVHDAVSEVGGVETASQGEEPSRYVVIVPLRR